MNLRRGLFRLALVLTVAFWAGALSLAVDAGAGYGPYAYQASEDVLKSAGLIYGVAFAVVWTLYGFFDRPRA